MKKILALILAMVFIVTLCACGDTKGNNNGSNNNSSNNNSNNNTSSSNSNISGEQSNVGSNPGSSNQETNSSGSSSTVTIPGLAKDVYAKARTFSSAKPLAKRNLNNTQYKLTKKKELNVLYYGGSITVGVGSSNSGSWSQRTAQWLKDTYPDAKINVTNKSISGQGTFLGLFRADRDAIANKPDLMFIELATNDLYQGFTLEQSAALVEGIIRKVRKEFPETDIVIVLTTDKSRLGTQFKTYTAHKKVADFYGIPTIDVGEALNQEMKKTGNSWDYYVGDIVHPNNNGHKVYADRVIEELKVLLPNNANSIENHKLPSEDYASNGIHKTQTITADKIEFEGGWKLKKASGHISLVGFTQGLAPEGAGSTLTFEFEGNTFGMLADIRRNANVDLIIDGKTTVRLHEKDATNEVERLVFDNLAPGKHVVTIKYNGPGYFAIGAICIGQQ